MKETRGGINWCVNSITPAFNRLHGTQAVPKKTCQRGLMFPFDLSLRSIGGFHGGVAEGKWSVPCGSLL